MKNYFVAVLALCFAHVVIADGHGNKLSFEARQEPAEMTITSVNLAQGGGTITAVGDMGEYGRVYTTYTLTADPGGMAGTVLGCLLYTSPSPRDGLLSRMPSSA